MCFGGVVMEKRYLTCIICPRGCSLTVDLDECGKPLGVAGNACPRGVDYAITECTAPMRTVTSTVRCADGSVIPVKTDRSVPKGKVFEVMAEINRTTAPSDLAVGDVVIADVSDTGAAVVVTGKKP